MDKTAPNEKTIETAEDSSSNLTAKNQGSTKKQENTGGSSSSSSSSSGGSLVTVICNVDYQELIDSPKDKTKKPVIKDIIIEISDEEDEVTNVSIKQSEEKNKGSKQQSSQKLSDDELFNQLTQPLAKSSQYNPKPRSTEGHVSLTCDLKPSSLEKDKQREEKEEEEEEGGGDGDKTIVLEENDSDSSTLSPEFEIHYLEMADIATEIELPNISECHDVVEAGSSTEQRGEIISPRKRQKLTLTNTEAQILCQTYYTQLVRVEEERQKQSTTKSAQEEKKEKVPSDESVSSDEAEDLLDN